MNKQYEMVKDFQKKMGQPVSRAPRNLDDFRVDERYGFMKEELDEFLWAKTDVDQADAMLDLIYLALGTMVEMGIRPENLFEIVHKANMSKLWEDGKPRVENGKIVKPPHFKKPEPELEEEIKRQILNEGLEIEDFGGVSE